MPQLRVDHVHRPMPPWREANLTECGLEPSAEMTVISRDELKTRIRDWGSQRVSMTTCMTCLQTARRWRTWAEKPGDVIARDVDRGSTQEMNLIDRELAAIALLIDEHPQEFADLMGGLADVTSLAEQRHAKWAREARAERVGGLTPIRPR